MSDLARMFGEMMAKGEPITISACPATCLPEVTRCYVNASEPEFTPTITTTNTTTVLVTEGYTTVTTTILVSSDGPSSFFEATSRLTSQEIYTTMTSAGNDEESSMIMTSTTKILVSTSDYAAVSSSFLASVAISYSTSIYDSEPPHSLSTTAGDDVITPSSSSSIEAEVTALSSLPYTSSVPTGDDVQPSPATTASSVTPDEEPAPSSRLYMLSEVQPVSSSTSYSAFVEESIPSFTSTTANDEVPVALITSSVLTSEEPLLSATSSDLPSEQPVPSATASASSSEDSIPASTTTQAPSKDLVSATTPSVASEGPTPPPASITPRESLEASSASITSSEATEISISESQSSPSVVSEGPTPVPSSASPSEFSDASASESPSTPSIASEDSNQVPSSAPPTEPSATSETPSNPQSGTPAPNGPSSTEPPVASEASSDPPPSTHAISPTDPSPSAPPLTPTLTSINTLEPSSPSNFIIVSPDGYPSISPSESPLAARASAFNFPPAAPTPTSYGYRYYANIISVAPDTSSGNASSPDFKLFSLTNLDALVIAMEWDPVALRDVILGLLRDGTFVVWLQDANGGKYAVGGRWKPANPGMKRRQHFPLFENTLRQLQPRQASDPSCNITSFCDNNSILTDFPTGDNLKTTCAEIQGNVTQSLEMGQGTVGTNYGEATTFDGKKVAKSGAFKQKFLAQEVCVGGMRLLRNGLCKQIKCPEQSSIGMGRHRGKGYGKGRGN